MLHNAGTKPIELNELRKLVPAMAVSLRSKAMNRLLNDDTSWQACWTPEEAGFVNHTTEAGPPAKTLQEFLSVLQREKRWICGLGLQALAAAQRINVAMFEMREGSWTRTALVVGDESKLKSGPRFLLLEETVITLLFPGLRALGPRSGRPHTVNCTSTDWLAL